MGLYLYEIAKTNVAKQIFPEQKKHLLSPEVACKFGRIKLSRNSQEANGIP